MNNLEVLDAMREGRVFSNKNDLFILRGDRLMSRQKGGFAWFPSSWFNHLHTLTEVIEEKPKPWYIGIKNRLCWNVNNHRLLLITNDVNNTAREQLNSGFSRSFGGTYAWDELTPLTNEEIEAFKVG